MSSRNSSFLSNHVFHIWNMKPTFVRVQKHCINESFLVTIPFAIAPAISITKGDVMKTGTRRQACGNGKSLIGEKKENCAAFMI